MRFLPPLEMRLSSIAPNPVAGLLVAQLDSEAQEDLRAHKNLHTYGGGLFENIVAEAIKKSGGELYYYRREDSKLEEDFFLRSRSNIVPIEVKATNGFSRRSSRPGDRTWVSRIAGRHFTV